MPTPNLIGPLPTTTPAVAAPRGRQPLPPDLLRDASRRLGVMSLVAAALWLLGTVLGHLAARSMAPAGDDRWSRYDFTDSISGASIALSLAMFAFTRRTTRRPQLVLDVGLAYMALMAFALGVLFHWTVPENYSLRPEISWCGALILLFAAIVPTTPEKLFVAGTIAACMNPLGMYIAHARGLGGYASASKVLLMHYPDFLLVGAGVVVAHVQTRLGRQVTRARELGSYRLGELLGRGGMGQVYRATHRMLARPAAIKLIRPEMLADGPGAASDVAAKRFTREAEAAAGLRSPHTVEVYDFGVADDATLYYVMELLDGMDLETLVREHGPVPAARAVHLVRQACDSLEEAHRAGMVHRDIKPANIHVGRVGIADDFVKVLDFGLVKPAAAGAPQTSLETADGWTPGTPAYMSPEMALGEAVDGRSDIYALGCVTYWLLTGELLFDADTPFRMVAKHVSAEPSPPSARTDSPVPALLDEIVLACVAKRPADRPATAAELSRRLGLVPLDAWTGADAADWWQRVGRTRADLVAAPSSIPTLEIRPSAVHYA